MVSPPQTLEAAGGRSGVSDGVLRIPVAEIILDQTRVGAAVGESEAAAVAKHVWVNVEWEISVSANFGHNVVDRLPRHRSTLGKKEQWRVAARRVNALP